MLHKHLLDFTRKYNKEFAIKGYSKLKKADLQQKIESVLNKQRTEIKEEYKKLKEMKTEPAKKTPVKKPAPKAAPVKKEPKKAEPKKDKKELKLYSIPKLSNKEDNPALYTFKGKIMKKEDLEERAIYWLNIMKNKKLTVNMNENIKNNNWIGTDDWEHHQAIIDYLVGVILQTYKLDNTLNKKINDIKNKKSMEYIKKKVKDTYSNYCLNQMKDAEKLIKEKNKYKINDITKDELKELEKRIIELKKECKKSDDLFNELFKERGDYKSPRTAENQSFSEPKSNKKVDELLFKIENNPNYNDNFNTLNNFLQKTKQNNIFPLELTFAFSQKQNEENFKELDSNPKLFMDFMAEIAKSIKDNNDLKFNILKKYDKKPSNMSVKSQGIIMKELKNN